MKENVPCILILFVPANMTELCQPLDVGFNFEFKRAVANARKEWIAKLVIDLVAEEGAEAAARFQPPKDLKTLKEKLVTFIAGVAQTWQCVEKQKHVAETCWGFAAKIFDPAFQQTASKLVHDDTQGVYFKATADGTKLDSENVRKVTRHTPEQAANRQYAPKTFVGFEFAQQGDGVNKSKKGQEYRMKIDSYVSKMKLFHVKAYVVYTDHEAKRASFHFSATRSEIQALFPDKPMTGVAAKAPPAANTKAKGKGKAPAKAQAQTALKSDPFAAPHDHDSAFQGGEGGGAGPIGGDLVPSRIV